MNWQIAGSPGQVGVLLADLEPGPTFLPGFGTFAVGFSSNFILWPIVLPASGVISYCDSAPCPKPFQTEIDIYLQGVTPDFASGTLLNSNSLVLRAQDQADFCEPPVCAANGSINSNFNGTAIAGGRHIWFNAIVKLQNIPSSGVTARFENAQVTLDLGASTLVVPVPSSTIIASPLVTTPQTVFMDGRWRTIVPAGYSGNIFLSGVALEVPPGGFPGGISPVTWSGDFSGSNGNLSFQWKWAAAVYTMFPSDYNALGVLPIDGGGHAGTPVNFGFAVTGGARGGGGSNFTGSYSGTQSNACQ